VPLNFVEGAVLQFFVCNVLGVLGQPSSLMRSLRFMVKPFVICFRASSSFFVSSLLSSSCGRSVALSLRSSSLTESSLSSICLS